MNLRDLKQLAEAFRPIAADTAAIAARCDVAQTANPSCHDCAKLIADLKAAPNSTAVLAVIDAVKTRTV